MSMFDNKYLFTIFSLTSPTTLDMSVAPILLHTVWLCILSFITFILLYYILQHAKAVQQNLHVNNSWHFVTLTVAKSTLSMLVIGN